MKKLKINKRVRLGSWIQDQLKKNHLYTLAMNKKTIPFIKDRKRIYLGINLTKYIQN